MGVSSTVNKVTYQGNGSSTSFSFGYYFFFTTDLDVYLYDTVAGGLTTCVLGTDYTVSGTANLQGIYPNGANVVMTVAPPATSILVIVRVPSIVNNYALLQNGNISSAAIVQQFDYLTLICQLLEDRISRAISLPDGSGEPFSNQLPSNVVLQPGMSPIVNSAGTGWTLGPASTWNKVAIPYTSFQTAGLTMSVALFTLPPACLLNGVVVKHNTAFAGSGISDVQVGVGVSSDTQRFIQAFDVYQSVSDTAFDYNEPNLISSWANSLAVVVTATAVGANLSALSAGSVEVWYQTTQLPAA